MNLPKFPHSAMFVGVTACRKTEFLLQLLETVYNNHFEFIVILCPTISDNKTYLSRKWIFDDKNVFIVCDLEGKLNEWIKLFKNALKGRSGQAPKISLRNVCHKSPFFWEKNWESCVTKSWFFSGPQTKKLIFVTLTKHCPFQHLRS